MELIAADEFEEAQQRWLAYEPKLTDSQALELARDCPHTGAGPTRTLSHGTDRRVGARRSGDFAIVHLTKEQDRS